MSWIKLDDQFFTHPKIVDLSKDAKLLYLAALTYCGAHLTDGVITRGALRVVAATVDVPLETADVLLAAGLWYATGDGVQINNYLQYQPSRENALALKEARTSAGRRGGYRSAAGRTQASSVAHAQADAPPDGQANAEALAQANGRQIPSHIDPELDVAVGPTAVLTALAVTGVVADGGNSRTQASRVGSRGRAATGGRALAGPPGWTFDALWALIEEQQGYRPTWDYTVEIKAIRQLLNSFPNVQPDDLARFLSYVATCWPFRDEPTRQPTFSEGAKHFGAWYTRGQPAVCPAGGSQHGPRQSVAQEREHANLAACDHIIEQFYAYDAAAGPSGGDSGVDPAHSFLLESSDSGRDDADAESDALGDGPERCAVVPFADLL